MTGRARIRQIDIERAIKAARKVGAPRVVVRDGAVSIELAPAPELSPQSTGAPPAPRKPMVF